MQDKAKSMVVADYFLASKLIKALLILTLLGSTCVLPQISLASSVQECMGKVKMFQNPSAMAGGAEVCMQIHFDNLNEAADTCRQEAAAKAIPSASYAACQASLIFELAEQVDDCRKEAEKLLTGDGEMQNQVIEGAKLGCQKLAEQAAAICIKNANKFSGLAQSTAIAACEQAGL
jgi:hypothetical protein